jgi:TDG/mug DNA glycosylase family protein
VADIKGFPPIAMACATVLILGSMPGRESLAQQRYYAHPRNAFWPIMGGLYNLSDGSYEEKTRELAGKGVAVWDVLQACFRSGSLDAHIDEKSIVSNDFNSFFAMHSEICRVFFNGAKAESVYCRHVVPGLEPGWARLPLKRLPSTSPAYAAMSLEKKAKAWKEIRDMSLE